MPPRSKVSLAVENAVQLANQRPGWQIVYWGYRRRLIFNIPQPDGTYQQHVYNPQLDAWARYVGLPAVCWCVWADRLFFGTPNGMVVEHGVGSSDQIFYVGSPWNISPWGSPWAVQTMTPINLAGQQAWNLFGTPLEKRCAALRAIVQSIGPATYQVELGYDYQPAQVKIEVSQAALATPWDVSPWGSPWSQEATVNTQWQIAGGDGSAISVTVAAAGYTQLNWVRSDFRIEPGAAL
jgi:hypothetical protein